MQLLRTLGVLLLATVIGLVLGAAKEYLKLWPDSGYDYVWPLAMGGAAFAGALLMAIMGHAPARQPIPANTAASRSKSQTVPASSTALTRTQPSGVQTSSEVPGMPTFDFDKAKAAAGAIESAKQAEGSKQQEQA